MKQTPPLPVPFICCHFTVLHTSFLSARTGFPLVSPQWSIFLKIGVWWMNWRNNITFKKKKAVFVFRLVVCSSIGNFKITFAIYFDIPWHLLITFYYPNMAPFNFQVIVSGLVSEVLNCFPQIPSMDQCVFLTFESQRMLGYVSVFPFPPPS